MTCQKEFEPSHSTFPQFPNRLCLPVSSHVADWFPRSCGVGDGVCSRKLGGRRGIRVITALPVSRDWLHCRTKGWNFCKCSTCGNDNCKKLTVCLRVECFGIGREKGKFEICMGLPNEMHFCKCSTCGNDNCKKLTVCLRVESFGIGGEKGKFEICVGLPNEIYFNRRHVKTNAYFSLWLKGEFC